MTAFRLAGISTFLLVSCICECRADQTYFGTPYGNNKIAADVPPAPEQESKPAPPSAGPEKPAEVKPETPEAPPELTVADWQKKAVKEFPSLADPKSELNHKFIQQVNELKSSNPAYFRDPKWPFTLAQSVNDALNPIIPGVSLNPLESQPTPTPTPEPTPTPKPTPVEPKPFDQLDKENVRLECKVNTGAKINDRFNNGEGFYSVDKTVTKEIIVTVTQTGRTKVPVTVEAFFVLSGSEGEMVIPAGSQKLETGEGSPSFTNSSRGKKTVVNYDTPLISTEGKKISGWLVRALAADGRTLGVAASSEKSLGVAKNPKLLAAELARNKKEP